jgi:hypothetical protein
VVKRFGCVVLKQEMQLFCMMQLGVPKESEELFLQKTGDMHGVQIRLVH